jgi:hypothetical protein
VIPAGRRYPADVPFVETHLLTAHPPLSALPYISIMR